MTATVTQQGDLLRRLLRFRMLSLFFVVFVAAVGFWFTLPFTPKLKFSEPVSSSYVVSDGIQVPTSVITVTNNGFFPIWYSGFDGEIRNFSWLALPSQYSSQPEGDWSSRSTSSAHWCKLSRNQSVVVEVPKSILYTEAKVGIQVQDWRGRAVDLWSQPFPHSHAGPR